MADICRMVLRIDVVVLEDSVGIKVVHETMISEMFVNLLCLLLIYGRWSIGQAWPMPFSPLRLMIVSWETTRENSSTKGWVPYHNEKCCMRPFVMDILDQFNVGMIKIPSGYLIWIPMIISTHLNEDKISRLFGWDVPLFRLVGIELVRPNSGIGCTMPIPCLQRLLSISRF